MGSQPGDEVHVCGVLVKIVPEAEGTGAQLTQLPHYQICLLAPGHPGKCVIGPAYT